MNDFSATKRPPKSPVVPRKYGGQWVAWDHDHTRIIASGTTYAEARKAAVERLRAGIGAVYRQEVESQPLRLNPDRGRAGNAWTQTFRACRHQGAQDRAAAYGQSDCAGCNA